MNFVERFKEALQLFGIEIANREPLDGIEQIDAGTYHGSLFDHLLNKQLREQNLRRGKGLSFNDQQLGRDDRSGRDGNRWLY